MSGATRTQQGLPRPGASRADVPGSRSAGGGPVSRAVATLTGRPPLARLVAVRRSTVLYVLVAVVAGLLDLLTTVGLQSGTANRLSGEPMSQVVPTLLLVGMVAVLLLRRDYPFVVLLAVLSVSSTLALWIETASPVFCAAVAVYTAAGRARESRAFTALLLALSYALLLVSLTLGSQEEPLTPVDVALAGVLTSIFLTVPWAFGRVDASREARTEALTHELEQSARQATHAERQRIARELHDILAHSVSAMMMQAAGARAVASTVAQERPDDERIALIQKALGNVEGTGSQSLRELSRLLGALRQDGGSSTELEGPALAVRPQPGPDELEQLLETPRQSGLIVEVHRSGARGTLDPSVGAAAYRVVQESLTNALKHGGPGTVVDIYKAWQGETLQLQVRSRATHETAALASVPSGGHGLHGLRERVELVGGSLEAGPVGEEFVVTSVLPAHPPEDGPRPARAAGEDPGERA